MNSEYNLPGFWKGNTYFVDHCPLCGEQLSFRFHGLGVWQCVACDRSGDIDDLKALLIDMPIEAPQAPDAPDGLIVVSEYVKPKNIMRAATGFNPLDRMLGGFAAGMLTVLTGKRGEGKSTFAGQVALNLINADNRVCFYSGELNAGMFQDWVMTQAAGIKFLDAYEDSFGETRYRIDQYAEPHIKSWLGKKMILYDCSIVKSSERNTILERFQQAYKHYGCNIFFVDNLMTAKYPIDNDRDYYRAQSNFVGDLVDFALSTQSHVVLVAHPRKSNSGDKNDNVAGMADITNRASNVIEISKADDDEREEYGCDAMVYVTKNRDYGDTGMTPFGFDKPTRRFTLPDGKAITQYNWEG